MDVKILVDRIKELEIVEMEMNYIVGSVVLVLI